MSEEAVGFTKDPKESDNNTLNVLPLVADVVLNITVINEPGHTLCEDKPVI